MVDIWPIARSLMFRVHRGDRMKNHREPHFCPVAYRSISCGDGSYFIRLPLQDRTLSISAHLHRILAACHGFRTIAGHIEHASKRLKPESSDSIPEGISRLRALDLLKPCAWAVPAKTRDGSRLKVSSLGIVTADRPDECMRAVRSYDANLRLHSQSTNMIVMDDSHRPNDLEISLREHASSSGRVLRFAGLVEKLAYIEVLSRAGIDADIARFAILGDVHPDICSIGANRNALLLDTVGECVFSADDDTICELRAHPVPSPGFKLQCSGNPRDSWFYANRESVIGEKGWANHDLLTEHEKMLGRSAAELSHDAGFDQVDADRICSDLLYALQTESGVVRVTMSGIIGDSGAYCSNWILWLDGASRRRLGEDHSLFQTALHSRETFGVVQRPTIDHSGFFAATTMALANNELLPPFIPIGRNEDGMFGALLKMAIPNALVGHIPLAVLHAPNHGRAYVAFPEFRLSDLFLSLFARLHISVTMLSVSTLLRRVGHYLIEISSLPDVELSEVIAEAVCEREARRISGTFSFNRGLSSTTPEYFEDAFTQYRLHLMRRTTIEQVRTPIELDGVFRGSAFLKMKEIIGLTGRLLYCWPDIVEASLHLKGAGRRVTKEI